MDQVFKNDKAHIEYNEWHHVMGNAFLIVHYLKHEQDQC